MCDSDRRISLPDFTILCTGLERRTKTYFSAFYSRSIIQYYPDFLGRSLLCAIQEPSLTQSMGFLSSFLLAYCYVNTPCL